MHLALRVRSGGKAVLATCASRFAIRFECSGFIRELVLGTGWEVLDVVRQVVAAWKRLTCNVDLATRICKAAKGDQGDPSESSAIQVRGECFFHCHVSVVGLELFPKRSIRPNLSGLSDFLVVPLRETLRIVTGKAHFEGSSL